MGDKKKSKARITKTKASKWAEVRRSGIHQKGLFARRKIPEGKRIIEYVGEKISKKESERRRNQQDDAGRATGDGTVYVFIVNKRFDVDGNVPWNPARFANHSCEPNACTDVIKDRIWLIAARDIEKGEEIVYDYGFDLDCWEENPCRCGAKSCVGYIVSEEYRSKLKRKLKAREKKNEKKEKQKRKKKKKRRK